MRTRSMLAAAALAGGAVLATVIPAQAEEADAGETVPAAAVVLSHNYRHAEYDGSIYYVTGSYGCDNSTDIDWSVGDIVNSWNDKISSVKSFSKCTSMLHENNYFRGASLGFFKNRQHLGDMNDETSSIRLR
ncbi:hypothetical protein [Streptomyces lasiicapitis]|uniref:Beta/gamma crystallin family protein n=1 Tax=Streptomyces lasiicapitis TaxID=1923961 RepID=A0ABQ2LWL3_9ACTN|nr:hypothetical protein [Streptomyces lasiicapitis]GGO43113.1 hypothetical protein GCM10012286_26210 [Streptomyces lasiicapitis]